MNGKTMGVLIAVAFGIVLFWLGWGAALSVLALALGGWFVGKLISGEIDLAGYIDNISHRRAGR